MLRIRVAAALALACVLSFLAPESTPRAISPDIVISQVYGGGGNSGATYTHDFIELFNRGTVPVDVTGWSVQYASASGTTWQQTVLSGTIQPGAYFLIQEAQGAGGSVVLPTPDVVGNILMSGTSAKVVLRRDSAVITAGVSCPTGDANTADFVGYGTANCFEGSAAVPATSNPTAAIRGGNGCTDTDNNFSDFSVAAATPRNSASPVASCVGPTNPGGTGLATPASVEIGGTTLLTVTATTGTNPTSTGLTVTANLGAIGGASTQPFFDDGTNGDSAAGDLVFSYRATVSGPAGSKTLPVTITDAQARSGTASISLTVNAPVVAADVVISQVYGGGGNANAPFRNDFIELYNQGNSPVNLAGWSVQYASATGTSWTNITPLTGTIQPHGYFLIQEAGSGSAQPLPAPDVSGGINMSATTGKVALVASTTPLTGACSALLAASVDFVGYGTSASCFEGSGPAPAPSNADAIFRADAGSIDTDNNAVDFSAATPFPRNSVGVPPVARGSALPAVVVNGGETLLTVTVTPGDLPPSTGIAVTADLSSIGGLAAQPLYDDGTHGDGAAGDSTYSFSTVVSGSAGLYDLRASVLDAQSRSASATIQLGIEGLFTPIYAIQGTGSTSPFAGQLVTTSGIVTALRGNGFYIQVPDSERDGDAATSDGIFVFTSSAPSPAAVVGALVRVIGTVHEFQPAPQPPLTEISGGPALAVVSDGNALPTPVILQPADTTSGGGLEQLERFEGMRVTADITAITGTDGSVNEPNAEGTSNGEFYAVIKGVPRPMREPGYDPSETLPPTAPCCVPAFDGNPEKLRVDSDGQAGATRIEIVAGQRIEGLTGVLDYGFHAYTILPDPGAPAPQGSNAAAAVAAPTASQFTIASYNMERFFDATNQNRDDVVMTPEGLNRRLSKASLAIRNVLRTPDILGAIEIENVTVLQSIADKVNADAVAAGEPNPGYVAYLEEGNDPGGIDVGFLVKSSRVEVVGVEQIGKTATYRNVATNTDDLLNDRPPLVLRARVHRPVGEPYAVTVIVNHLRSLNGMTDPGLAGQRVRDKRRLQAEFLANYIQQRQTADPAERIVSIGDYNAFEFNDGFVDLIGTIKGTPTPADQVVSPSADLVHPDLVNVGDLLGEQGQYSYTFDGNAQAIDHVLVNQAAFKRFDSITYAHMNADFPESFRSDAARPERLSDHDAAVVYLAFAGTPVLTLLGDPELTVEAYEPFQDPGATAYDEEFGALNVTVSGAVDVNTPGDYTLAYSATNGYFTVTKTRVVHVRDTTAPAIENFALSPAVLWPPDHTMSDVRASYLSGDASGDVSCALAVQSNEPANGSDDGDTNVDWEIVDPTAMRLRAERSGTGTGRVYGVTLTCVDPSGNRAIRQGSVSVPLHAPKL